MGIDTYITLAVILVIVGLAAAYVIKAKKSGKKCTGNHGASVFFQLGCAVQKHVE